MQIVQRHEYSSTNASLKKPAHFIASAIAMTLQNKNK
jgi:hypothetical protein